MSTFKETLEYAAVAALLRLVPPLPHAAVTAAARALGSAAFHAGVRRGVTLDNLAHAFPERSEAERRRIALGAYRNYATTITELLWSAGKSAETLGGLIRFHDRTPFDRLLAQGRGLVLLSGHFGGWELIPAAVIPKLGHPAAAIVQRQRNGKIDAMLDELRCRFGNSTIPMGPSSRRAVEVLKGGGVLLGLGDQSGPKEAAFVPFFGRPAATHRGMAAFALKFGAPLLLLINRRAADGCYDVFMEEVDRTGLQGAGEQDVVELTRRHTALLERYVRETPDQWLWMHKRWKHTAYHSARQQSAGGR